MLSRHLRRGLAEKFRQMPKGYIVDTNLPLVAAGAHGSATKACQLKCVEFIELILSGTSYLVLDINGEALDEYCGNIGWDPPDASLASLFLWHIQNNLGFPDRIKRVHLSKVNGEYEEWPQDLDLADFKNADRKWVALALTFERETGQKVPITYAIDRDWDESQEALERCGLILNCLCPKSSVVNGKRR